MKRVVVFALMLVACSKREAASAPSAKVGEPLKLEDSTWIVVDVKDVGKKVEPNEYATLFDAPVDAKGLKLQVRGFSLLGEKRIVELGL